MSIKGNFLLKSVHKEAVLLAFRLAMDAANAPTIVEGKEWIQSVAQTGTGVYTITLRENLLAALAMPLALEATAATDLVPQLLPLTGSGNTVSFRLNTGVTPTNAPAKGANVTYVSGFLAVRSV